MIIYGLLIYIGIKAAFPLAYHIFCTVGICFHLFTTLQNIAKEQQLRKSIMNVVEIIESSLKDK